MIKQEGRRSKAVVADEILTLTKSSLLMHFRFLGPAFSAVKTEAQEEGTFSCDGKCICYAPDFVIEHYKTEKNHIDRLYLHSIFHCLLRQIHKDTVHMDELWDLSCDIVVESIMLSLNQSFLHLAKDASQNAVLEELREKVPCLTAEVLWKHFRKNPLSKQELHKLQELFSMDDHEAWKVQAGKSEQSDESQYALREREDLDNELTKEGWEKLSRRALVELQDFQKHSDMNTESLLQNLQIVNRRRYDYSHFLKRFFTMHETMQVSPDTFDYIFYTYGLKMYGNVPLIEPLEYREGGKIREFVIVIDTSASVKGELVQKFLEHTFQILLQQEHFFARTHIRLIQCDSEIQEDQKICCIQDVRDCMENFVIRGLGTTDFRPAFQYVKQLQESGELKHLKGMLYFTDGEGIYPEQKPPFETAFVFLEEYMKEPKVPVWAIRMILSEEVLEQKAAGISD